MACFTATDTHGTADKGQSLERGSTWRTIEVGGVGTLRDIACSRMTLTWARLL